jgi:ElaB/YqjD/DUF883 family membrane-anchored ribosome-binding protein
MGETPVEIEAHIAEKRAELGRDLQEIEHRVREAVNWREQARRHPNAALAIGFGVGVLLGLTPSLRRR